MKKIIVLLLSCMTWYQSRAQNITAAEYFFDTDPGAGNGTALSVGASGTIVNFTASISTASLSNGFHLLCIRTKDINGVWGLFEPKVFYISQFTGNMDNVVDGEYFLDTDPGIGNGTAFSFTTPGNTVNQTFSFPIAMNVSNGNHLLVMRTRDANGFWGLFDTTMITVSGSTLPLHLLDFTGKKINDKPLLEWKTENEQNTSHFEIERSKNGMDFNPIGSVASVNSTGTNQYSFVDPLPIRGLNFYRLRQVDINGRFEYSTIIKLLFEGYGKPMILYPNPASNYIQFDFAGKQKTIYTIVYDAERREVINTTLANQAPMKINISVLQKGQYFVQLSDGETIATGSFIKQ